MELPNLTKWGRGCGRKGRVSGAKTSSITSQNIVQQTEGMHEWIFIALMFCFCLGHAILSYEGIICKWGNIQSTVKWGIF